jgi:hypothetical protein
MKHSQYDDYLDHSDDLVARVRRAKEAAQRKMEEFGDPSEYEITIIHSQKKEEPPTVTIQEVTQPSDLANAPEGHQQSERETTVELIEGDLRPPTQEE